MVELLDHIGGHISSSQHVPSSTLDHAIPELVRTLKDKETVIFHCALSQQRGPGAALKYLRERERLVGKTGQKGEASKAQTEEVEGDLKKTGAVEAEIKGQKVFVLDGGFVKWQEKYGEDKRLTDNYAKDIWQDGGNY
jgi:rhodanese-related sulfurtransferase